MAFGVFKLTARQRFCLGLAFTLLNITQISFGLIITGWSIYICVNVSPNLYSEKAEITFVFTVTSMYGTHIIIHYLVGIKICEKCYHKAHKKSTRHHLLIWTLICCNTILNIFILACMVVKVSKHIVRSLRHSIEKGMKNYLKSEKWKFYIDSWQYNMQCCGVNGYEDWFEISWLDKYHVNTDSEVVRQYRMSYDHLHLPILPWSCCRVDFPMQCFHDPLQQIQSQHVWADQPNLVLESINTVGCLDILREPTENALIGFIIITVFIITVQVAIICVSRLLYISCRNAIILGEPDGIAPGWIFSRGGLGVRSGKTLSEILLDMGMNLNEIPRYQELTTAENEASQYPVKTTKMKFSILSRMRKNKMKREENQQQLEESDAAPISTADEEALMLK